MTMLREIIGAFLWVAWLRVTTAHQFNAMMEEIGSAARMPDREHSN